MLLIAPHTQSTSDKWLCKFRWAFFFCSVGAQISTFLEYENVVAWLLIGVTWAHSSVLLLSYWFGRREPAQSDWWWREVRQKKKKKKTGRYILQKQMPQFVMNANASKVLCFVMLAWWRTCSPDPCWQRVKDTVFAVNAIHLLLPWCTSTDTSFTQPLKHPQLKCCIYWTVLEIPACPGWNW